MSPRGKRRDPEFPHFFPADGADVVAVDGVGVRRRPARGVHGGFIFADDFFSVSKTIEPISNSARQKSAFYE